MRTFDPILVGMRTSVFLFLFVLLSTSASWAQNSDLPVGHDAYSYLDRLDIRGRIDTTLHSELKPYGREQIQSLFAQADTSDMGPRERKWHQRMRLLLDDGYASGRNRTGRFSKTYPNQRDFFRVKTPQLQLFVNPVAHVSAGIERNNHPNAPDSQLPIYLNTRGAEVRGSLFNKVGFYTLVADNVTRVPYYLYQRYLNTERYYGETLVKTFGGVNGLDYLIGRGYLTYSPFKGMRIKFGRDRAFWGNGNQSLLLSDQSPEHLMLNITTRIWKLEYVNHFAQLTDFVPLHNDTEGDFPRKYAAFHQLSYKPNRNFSIGLFESVVYSSYLVNRYRGFELQYLNPIILYRAVEQSFGSPDNGLLGAQFKANLFKRVQVYGQLMMDDFSFGARQDSGLLYWGNKFGYQLGFKYIDAFGIPTLDIQGEWNQVRPYTYQHFNRSSAYTHYGMPLAHGAGANLNDYTLILRYHPIPQLHVHLATTLMRQGLDQDDLNYGGDPEQVTDVRVENRPSDFGVRVGQGSPLEVLNVNGRLSWQILKADMYLEAEGTYRRANEEQSLAVLFGFRSSFVGKVVKF